LIGTDWRIADRGGFYVAYYIGEGNGLSACGVILGPI
jgi:hypothetical protein